MWWNYGMAVTLCSSQTQMRFWRECASSSKTYGSAQVLAWTGSWRNIPISPIDPGFGEQTAQAGVIDSMTMSAP